MFMPPPWIVEARKIGPCFLDPNFLLLYTSKINLMDFYWIYDIPVFWAFIIIVGGFTLFGFIGARVVRRLFYKRLGYSHDRNEQISFFMSSLAVFYGITLGLVAVSTWENHIQVQEKVSKEAAVLAALYRDIGSFPEPIGTNLKQLLKKYTRYTIDGAWPMQQQGIVPTPGIAMITDFQNSLYGFEPADKKEEIIFGETLRMYNDYITIRRLRLMSIADGLPAIVWIFTVVGGLLNIMFLWLVLMEKRWMQILMTCFVSFFIGSMIFLIAAMDNPYRGKISVSPSAFEMVYEHYMQGE